MCCNIIIVAGLADIAVSNYVTVVSTQKSAYIFSLNQMIVMTVTIRKFVGGLVNH